MPSLPLLISLLISKERRRNQDKESQEANSNEGLPNDHRIDMLKESNEGSTNERTEEMEKESRVEAPTSRRQSRSPSLYIIYWSLAKTLRRPQGDTCYLCPFSKGSAFDTQVHIRRS